MSIDYDVSIRRPIRVPDLIEATEVNFRGFTRSPDVEVKTAFATDYTWEEHTARAVPATGLDRYFIGPGHPGFNVDFEVLVSAQVGFGADLALVSATALFFDDTDLDFDVTIGCHNHAASSIVLALSALTAFLELGDGIAPGPTPAGGRGETDAPLLRDLLAATSPTGDLEQRCVALLRTMPNRYELPGYIFSEHEP